VFDATLFRPEVQIFWNMILRLSVLCRHLAHHCNQAENLDNLLATLRVEELM
jgi:hypothetical protein